jgi:carboxypeptidase D
LSTEFYVDGSRIPEVDFDVGESYAGLLPISSAKNESRKLFFWFFPTNDPLGQDDLTIWLNGGPGCSSMEGLIKENGPFLWQSGTFKPVQNPWSWTNLTNMIWIDQPVGTGFSQGIPSATGEKDISTQFLGFFKEFIDTFEFYGKKIYITGESYAGVYVPFIADAMFNANDTKYFNVQSTLIYDPLINSFTTQQQVPMVAFVDYWKGLFALNASFMADIHTRADECGYTSYLNDNLVFPPKGPLPPAPTVTSEKCDVFDDILDAVFLVNPCFDVYQIATTCPLLWDVIGFPSTFPYLPPGAELYFDRSDVKRHLHVPQTTTWVECSLTPVFVNGTDITRPSGLSVLPGVIERSKRTIIGHGMLDMVLMANGTLLSIQNMTWNGMQGFQSEPKDDFFVPYHTQNSLGTLAGAGVMGTTHTERSLTWVAIQLSGHMYALPPLR